MPEQSADSPILSSFAHDAEMIELVEMFVDELPDRVAVFAEALETESWEEARTISHQLKGAAPGYGFDSIGEAAGRIERLVIDQAAGDEMKAAVESLLSLCNRVVRP